MGLETKRLGRVDRLGEKGIRGLLGEFLVWEGRKGKWREVLKGWKGSLGEVDGMGRKEGWEVEKRGRIGLRDS